MFRIAIDGTASAGKGSIAKLVAQQLNIAYIDTGAMYRTVAWMYQKNGFDIKDDQIALDILERGSFHFFWEDNTLHISFNGEDISSIIRSKEIGQISSVVSSHASIRSILSSIQKQYAQTQSLVMDGRDIATVIIPDAELKVFVDADVRTRASRRHQELLQKGQECSLEDIVFDLEQRDQRDRTREVAPLIQAEDALLLDTTNRSIQEGVEQVIHWVKERKGLSTL